MIISNMLPDRVHANILPEPISGCWLWLGNITAAGYGQISVDRKREYSHRALYREFKGEIPQGLEIDHLCRVKLCCNPQHLEAVTGQVNCQRAQKKDACKWGHPYAIHGALYKRKNRPGPKLSCLACNRIRMNAAYARKVGKA